MRFTMQLAEVTTPVPPGPIDADAVTKLGEAFEAAYASLYGKDAGFREAGMQIITYRMRARARLPIHPELPHVRAMAASARGQGARRRAFLDIRRGWQDTAVLRLPRPRSQRSAGRPGGRGDTHDDGGFTRRLCGDARSAWQYGHPLFGRRLKRRLYNAAHSRFRI